MYVTVYVCVRVCVRVFMRAVTYITDVRVYVLECISGYERVYAYTRTRIRLVACM